MDLFFKKKLVFSIIGTLALLSFSYAQNANSGEKTLSNQSNFSVKYGFGINFITPFAFFDAPYVAYGVTDKNYANGISSDSAYLAFQSKQYSQREKTNYEISSYDNLNSLIYDLTTYVSFVFDKRYVLKINFDFLISNKRDESYAKGFILDKNNPETYLGIIEGDRENTFSLYGFTFGPEFHYKFNEIRDLPLSFILGSSLNMGTFFLLQNTSRINGTVSFLNSSGSIHNGSGDLKTSDDVLSDGLYRHSAYKEEQATSYVNPFMLQWKIIAGMDIRLSKLVTSELFVGFVLTYLNIQKLKIKIDRTVAPVNAAEGNAQTLKMEKAGFQKSIPSFIIGASLFFNVKN